jgi:tetratricopeptide (TPR) repeat protein
LLDYAEAVADFDEALRLRPNDPHVLNNRGNARACHQDFPGAVADFDAALKVDQSYTAALYNRAVVDLITGEARAIETGKRLANLERRAPVLAPYALVVSHLAARQVGRVKEAKEALDLATRLVPGDLWPSPVLKFLRGELKADALLAAAKDNDQRTVAHGVLGYDALLKNNKEGARDHFTWVVEQGNRGFAQFIMARAELAKLEKR